MRALPVGFLGLVLAVVACSAGGGATNGSDGGSADAGTDRLGPCEQRSVGPAVIDADRLISFRFFGDARIAPQRTCDEPKAIDAGTDAAADSALDGGDASIVDAGPAEPACDAGPPPCTEGTSFSYNRDTRAATRNICPPAQQVKTLSDEQAAKLETALRAIEGFEAEICGYDGSVSGMFVGPVAGPPRRGYANQLLGHTGTYGITHVAQYVQAQTILTSSF